ncbi:hypothetical protein NK718_01955 [Alsobacter sp. SYSU M60028]|uniref:Uncharacterized protein n=1 Tax=Alsobacter ponti TaxID=2962936 RepID=A0ABT1L8I9_9HYPH|nr:hypothetical protein [Alsobacter ponti]MCP8937266.1 hypothetical protein [Alsobacter ponti]
MDDRKRIARFVGMNFGLGAVIGFAFVAAILVLDVSGLRSIAATTEGGAMAVMLLLMGCVSLATGAMLSTAPADDPRPVPVRSGARDRRR